MKKELFIFSLAALGFGCEKTLSPEEVLQSSKDKILEAEQIGFNQMMLWEDPNLGDIDTIFRESFYQKNPNAELGYDFFGKKEDVEFWFVENVSYGVDHKKREVTVWENQPDLLRGNAYRSFSPIHLLVQEQFAYRKDTVISKKTLMDFVWVEMDTVISKKKIYLENHLFINPANSLPEFLSRRLYHDGKRNQLIEVFYSNYTFYKGEDPLQPNFPKGYISKVEDEKTIVSNLLKVGDTAPDFKLQDMQGKWVKLSDFQGKKVLLDFSMIHCGWCKIAIDEFKKPSFSFAENVVPLYVNPVDEQAKMEKYQARVGIPFPALIDAQEVAMTYGVKGYPTFYLIDEKGKIELVNEGYSDNLIQILNSHKE